MNCRAPCVPLECFGRPNGRLVLMQLILTRFNEARAFRQPDRAPPPSERRRLVEIAVNGIAEAVGVGSVVQEPAVYQHGRAGIEPQQLGDDPIAPAARSEAHTSELHSLTRITYALLRLINKNN